MASSILDPWQTSSATEADAYKFLEDLRWNGRAGLPALRRVASRTS